MKKIVFLWIMAALMFACNDDKVDDDPEQPAGGALIENLDFPKQDGALNPGSELLIKGKGFTETSKIYFRAADGDRNRGNVERSY